MSKVILSPCPFCGGEAAIEDMSDSDDTNYGAGCCDAGCVGHETLNAYYFTGEEAARDWNRRAPQPFTVIAPPLEWGEWSGDEDLPVRWMESRCGNYTIGHDPQKGIIEPFHQAGVLFTLGTKGTESEAIATCQAHAQEQVNQAIKGCNVVEYKDPQPLLGKLRSILREHNEKVFHSLPKVGVSGLVELHTNMHRALKNELDQWEGE